MANGTSFTKYFDQFFELEKRLAQIVAQVSKDGIEDYDIMLFCQSQWLTKYIHLYLAADINRLWDMSNVTLWRFLTVKRSNALNKTVLDEWGSRDGVNITIVRVNQFNSPVFFWDKKLRGVGY